jgi:hypothetical protein
MNQETFTTEPEIEIINDFSPLDAPVKERGYTQHNISDAQIMEDLEEPTFQPPSFNDMDDGDSEEEPSRPFNQEYSELDGKEKTMGAKMMVEMAIDLYEKGCGLLGKIPEISETKLDRLISEGEIDANIQIPTESGDLPVKEFAREYNDSIKDAFSVSDDFKEKIKPPLERVFKKRGIGMTDEQLVGYYFATDFITKGVQVGMLYKTTKGIFDTLKENTLALKNSQIPIPPKPEPFRDTESKPRNINNTDQEPIDKDVYTDNIGDFVSSYNEKPKTNPKPKKSATNLEAQLEYFEPEEEANGVFSVLSDNGGFKTKTIIDDNMPNFGDPEILAGIDKIEKQSQQKTTSRRRTIKIDNNRNNAKRPIARKPRK